MRRKEGAREDGETRNLQWGGTRSKLATPDRAEPQSGNLVLSSRSRVSSSIKKGFSRKYVVRLYIYSRVSASLLYFAVVKKLLFRAKSVCGLCQP